MIGDQFFEGVSNEMDYAAWAKKKKNLGMLHTNLILGILIYLALLR